MDIKEFFGTDWRAMMSEAALKEADRLNELCPLDRAKEGCEIWKEEGPFKSELKWNLWAKAYKDRYRPIVSRHIGAPVGPGNKIMQPTEGVADGTDPFYMYQDDFPSDYSARMGSPLLACIDMFKGEGAIIDFSEGQHRDEDGKYQINLSNFHQFIFPGIVSFNHAKFMLGLGFEDTIFMRDATFHEAIFTQVAEFQRAIFHYEANFELVIFEDKTDFANSRFYGRAMFLEAVFQGETNFLDTCFAQAVFAEAQFIGDAHFHKTTCTYGANFRKAEFSKKSEFSNSLFCKYAIFTSSVAAEDINLTKSYFLGSADFSHADIKGKLVVYKVGFGSKKYYNENDRISECMKEVLVNYRADEGLLTVPDFIGMRTEVTPDLSFTDIKYHPDVKDEHASAKFRKLKEMAAQTSNHSKELDYFREELINKPHSGDEGDWTKSLIWFYENVARCGTSAALPMAWLFGLTLIFPILYIELSPNWDRFNMSDYDLLMHMKYSLHQSLPFFAFGGEEKDVVVNYLYGSYKEIPNWTGFFSGVQKAISLTLEFLIGLGIRNYYRM